MRLPHLGTLAGTALFLLTSGCSQFYNEGFAFLRVNDPDEVESYDQFAQFDPFDSAQPLAQDPQEGPWQPQGDSPQLAKADDPPQPESEVPVPFRSGLEQANLGDKRPSYTAQMTDRGVGSLGLYGQIDMTQEGLSSALDGLDNLRRVTVTSEGADFDPEMDPTGQMMVYASTRHRDTSDIYIKRIGGNAITQLTDDPSNDVMPSISPDGTRVAFTSDRAGNWDIYLMDIAGGKAIQLTRETTHDIHPSFSSDGRKLVYCSYGSPSGQWEMVVIDVDKPASKKFIGHGLFPTWSPVENRILYQRPRQRGTRWFSVWAIELKEDGDAGQPTEIAASANAAVITPDWSPSGSHIVFCTVIEPDADEVSGPKQADIWIMNTDGSGRTRLTEGRYANLQPAWSETGSIYFVSDRGVDGVENVWALRPDRALQLAARKEDEEGVPSVMVPTQ